MCRLVDVSQIFRPRLDPFFEPIHWPYKGDNLPRALNSFPDLAHCAMSSGFSEVRLQSVCCSPDAAECRDPRQSGSNLLLHNGPCTLHRQPVGSSQQASNSTADVALRREPGFAKACSSLEGEKGRSWLKPCSRSRGVGCICVHGPSSVSS